MSIKTFGRKLLTLLCNYDIAFETLELFSKESVLPEGVWAQYMTD